MALGRFHSPPQMIELSQDSPGLWIPRRGFRIPGIGFGILCQRNLDSEFQSLVGFRIV